MRAAHEIKLYPTPKQEAFFRKSCGVARFAFNWGLAKWKEMYEAKEKTSAYTLIKNLTSVKRKEFPWMMEVGKSAPQYAIHNVEDAYKHYFKAGRKVGRPKFKKKGVHDSFVAVENKQAFGQENHKLWIPRYSGKVNNVTVKRIADMWFAVINIDVPASALASVSENQAAVVGVDRGIKHLAVTSDGKFYENPKALAVNLKSLKRQQRFLSRKMKGSNNRRKQRMKVARLHYKISCVRKYAIHQATNAILKSGDKIVVEDLGVQSMMQNAKLARAIGDSSWGEFLRQLKYKAQWQGKEIIVADRYFASSKTCSCCGWKNDNLKLSDRTFVCLGCGFTADRDLNASLNLAKYGSTLKVSGSNACGEGSSFLTAMPEFSPSMKQDFKIKHQQFNS